MENSLFLILLLFVNTSCDTRQLKQNENKKAETEEKHDVLNIINSGQKIIDFQPDTLVQGFVALNNSRSLDKVNLEITPKKLVEFVRESPVFIFSNKSNKEYLIAYQYEGAIENEFSCFEIGYMSDFVKNDNIIHSSFENFILESGLQLGISFEELRKIKGDTYVIEEDKVTYRITDYLHSKFLKKYNMPSYFLECTLMDDKIVRIKFGFDYP